MLLPEDLLHLSSEGTRKMIEHLGLSDKIKPTTGNRPSNRWLHNGIDRNKEIRKSRIQGSGKMHQHHPFPTASFPQHSSGRYPQQGGSPPFIQGHVISQDGAQNSSAQNSSHGPRHRFWQEIKNLPHLKKTKYFKSERDPLST